MTNFGNFLIRGAATYFWGALVLASVFVYNHSGFFFGESFHDLGGYASNSIYLFELNWLTESAIVYAVVQFVLMLIASALLQSAVGDTATPAVNDRPRPPVVVVVFMLLAIFAMGLLADIGMANGMLAQDAPFRYAGAVFFALINMAVFFAVPNVFKPRLGGYGIVV